MPVELAQVCVDRTGMVSGLDDAIWTMHWQLAAADHASRLAATGKIETFWDGVKNSIHPSHKLREVKWYATSTEPPHTLFKETIFTALPVGSPGTSGSFALPPQNAMSVTLKTTPRRHWGRFYLPGVTAGVLDTTGDHGFASQAKVDDIVANAATLCGGTGANIPC